RTKEVITQKEFEKNLQWHGFDKKWASRIWDAHFQPPDLGDILTSWRRGEITEDRVDELMLLVDLDPRYKQQFDTRKYYDPSITIGRYMFELGSIGEEGVKEIVHRQGYFPEHVDVITEYIVQFQERLWRRRYIVQLQRGYARRVISEDELRAAVKDASYTDGVADWIIKTADVQREIAVKSDPEVKRRLLGLGDLKKAFATDKINEDEYRSELMIRGYEIGDVDLLITMEDEKKVTTEAGGRKLALSEAQLLNAWKFGHVTRDYVEVELQLRGLTTDEVNILLDTKESQWGLTK
ncbi:unnamed protein product, partial [marine sediment metagenome]